MPNWYGWGAATAGAAEGYTRGVERRRQREQEGRVEAREQARFDTQQAEAQRRAERDQANFEFERRKQELDYDRQALELKIQQRQYASQPELERLDRRRKAALAEQAELSAMQLESQIAGEGVEPRKGAGRAVQRRYERWRQKHERELKTEGAFDALRALISGSPDEAERLFNSKGDYRIQNGTLRPTEDPDDPEFMFEYIDADTGQRKILNAYSLARQFKGGIGEINVMGDRRLMLFDENEWKKYQADQRLAERYGAGRGRAGATRQMIAVARELVRSKDFPDLDSALMALQMAKHNPMQLIETMAKNLHEGSKQYGRETMTYPEAQAEAEERYLEMRQRMLYGEREAGVGGERGGEEVPTRRASPGAGAGLVPGSAGIEEDLPVTPGLQTDMDLLEGVIGSSGVY